MAERVKSRVDESAQAGVVLSWAYVVLFVFLTSVGQAFYSSQSLAPSSQFEVLSRWGLVRFVWYWIECQRRAHVAALPLDTGLFVYLLGPFVVPLLLWRSQRWRSLLKAVILIAIWAVGHALSVALHHAMVRLQ